MADNRRPGTMSDDERALIGRDRRTPPKGVPNSPDFVEEEITGKYSGPELYQARSSRPTELRIARLEDKHDSLGRVVADVRERVGEMSGKLDVLPELVSVVRAGADRAAEREHATLMDDLDAKRQRRTFWLKLAAATITGGAIGKVLHSLGIL